MFAIQQPAAGTLITLTQNCTWKALAALSATWG
jgi:hypothetical protein